MLEEPIHPLDGTRNICGVGLTAKSLVFIPCQANERTLFMSSTEVNGHEHITSVWRREPLATQIK
jgi:hypothetical protein